MPANLKTEKNVIDRPPVDTETARFLPADFENSRFENRTLTVKFWKRHRVNTWKWWKWTLLQRFRNELKWFISLAPNFWRDYTEVVTVEFSIVFKLCRYRVNASPNFATVTFFTVFKMCRHRVSSVFRADAGYTCEDLWSGFHKLCYVVNRLWHQY